MGQLMVDLFDGRDVPVLMADQVADDTIEVLVRFTRRDDKVDILHFQVGLLQNRANGVDGKKPITTLVPQITLFFADGRYGAVNEQRRRRFMLVNCYAAMKAQYDHFSTNQFCMLVRDLSGQVGLMRL